MKGFRQLSQSDYGHLCLTNPVGADAYIRACHKEIDRLSAIKEQRHGYIKRLERSLGDLKNDLTRQKVAG